MRGGEQKVGKPEGRKAGIKVGRRERGKGEMKAVWWVGEKIHRIFSRGILWKRYTILIQMCSHIM